MPPVNAIYIIQGEISLVVTAMRRTSRWNSHSHQVRKQDDDADPLLSTFSQLKDVINGVTELEELDPNIFLGPFLDVIRSEDTTGPVTGLALTSVNKILSYGLVDPGSEQTAACIENIADAVTHARFVGTDPNSDEVVLMKILHVLRTLLLCPAGVQLTNESVCEIMQSCFRICFEMRLSELLRKSAEHTLMDMVQLLFTRLPQFKEDPKWSANMKKLKMRAGGSDPSRVSKKKRSPKPKQRRVIAQSSIEDQKSLPTIPGEQVETDMLAVSDNVDQTSTPVDRTLIATTPVTHHESGIIDIAKGFQDASDKEYQIACTISEKPEDDATDTSQQEFVDVQTQRSVNGEPEIVDPPSLTQEESKTRSPNHMTLPVPNADETLKNSPSETDMDRSSCASEGGDDESGMVTDHSDAASVHDSEYVNPQGVRFTNNQHGKDGSAPLIPYGLPCVRELFRFLISLSNPLDRHNTDTMVHMGLNLLTAALESGADHVSMFNSLLYLVKDEMCRYLFMLMQSERLSLFAAALRVCFLLFESMRSHLKFQLEMYLTRLSDIIVSDSQRISYEMREIALESIAQLWRIPGLVTELFLNYDCDLYCTNLFEDLTKLLSKNAFPVSGIFTTHLLSLDALLTILEGIEQHCQSRILAAPKSTGDAEKDKLPENSKTVAEGRSSTATTSNGEVSTDSASVVPPPPSGYLIAQTITQAKDLTTDTAKFSQTEARHGPQIRANRMKISAKLPTLEEIAILKHKKKVYHMGTEQFNAKPSKGIAYLQEQGHLSSPLNTKEVVTFIQENPKMDKKMIGEYISNRKNTHILPAYVKSFNFEDIRIDEALRLYLEAFRLPGEAPVISSLMDAFAAHWHQSNGEPFANADAAFTLAYAIIMLNVDQHNTNVKKQSVPMTLEQFKKNVSKTNGTEDFDSDMLDEIYAAIKSEEIVMPDEHTGLVKDNYQWKVLLRSGIKKEGVFIHAPTGSFDHALFTLIWGPTVAALSFVFDKSSDESIIQKAISGFRKCAMISAHYGMSDVFDNLVISLCKFTTLLSTAESPENIPVAFGTNMKAQLAARTVFGLAHRHGDILKEGWKNILDCTLQLFRAKMLPKALIEAEDFADSSGKICILKEENTSSQRTETGVLSSFYSYFTLSESTNQKGPTPEEQEASKQAHSCIRDCHLEHLISESKFLREESLQELVKALIHASQGPDGNESEGNQHDEDSAVFFLEFLIKVVLQNRDRVTPIWQPVRDHIYNLSVNAMEQSFLSERAVVGLLRLAIRLLRREEIAGQVLTSLRILLMMRRNVIHSATRQITFGLHELLRTNAANIHSASDWYTLFMLLEVAGAGANPPPLLQVRSGVNVRECISDAGAQSDSDIPSSNATSDITDRGYTSDSELYDSQGVKHRTPTELEVDPAPGNGSWMLVNKDDAPNHHHRSSHNQYRIDLNEDLQYCDSKSLLKASETLAFLVRDAAHITPHNFESCVHAIRTFVEASLNGGHHKLQNKAHNTKNNKKPYHKMSGARKRAMIKSHSTPSHMSSQQYSDEESEYESTMAGLQSLSIQLLDLMHTLHTRAASIFGSWAQEEQNGDYVEKIDAGTKGLWLKCWCPLLQGIARLCCDSRFQVRSQALTYLQRALLVHDLQTLQAVEWEACFNKVLFPLLTKLLEIRNQDPTRMEETRMRASTLLCKVFLQHLGSLLSLSTFTALWLTILDFMDKYMHADNSDLLSEAIPESLKNMLLVMDKTAHIFQNVDGIESQLWKLTWDRIETFLPSFMSHLFKPHEAVASKLVRQQPTSESSHAAGSVCIQMPEGTDTGNVSPISSPTHPTPGTQAASPRPESPLTMDPASSPASAYILQPPLPSVSSLTAQQIIMATDNNAAAISPSVPLLLNPNIMTAASAIPFITPQATPKVMTERQ